MGTVVDTSRNIPVAVGLFGEPVLVADVPAEALPSERRIVPANTGRRPHARKIKGRLGPFATECAAFDKGRTREIEIVSVTPHGITYRLKGQSAQYTIGHAAAFQRAVSVAAGVETGPRSGRIVRGMK
jgi:hypothetical protein